MKQQFDSFYQSFELSRQLSTQALSAFEKLVSLNINHTQNFISRSSQVLRAACAEMSQAQEPAQWSEAFQNGLRNSFELTREAMLAATDYQTESQHLLQDQAAEVEKLISATFSEQLVVAKTAAGRERRVGKSATLLHKLAA